MITATNRINKKILYLLNKMHNLTVMKRNRMIQSLLPIKKRLQSNKIISKIQSLLPKKMRLPSNKIIINLSKTPSNQYKRLPRNLPEKIKKEKKENNPVTVVQFFEHRWTSHPSRKDIYEVMQTARDILPMINIIKRELAYEKLNLILPPACEKIVLQ